MNLLALCKGNDLEVEVKAIPVTNPLQKELENLFLEQEKNFRDSRPNEITFNGEWKPDDDEMLTIANTTEANVMIQASLQNVVALPKIDTANFEGEDIRALFMSLDTGDSHRLLVQKFTAQQRLSHRFTILLQQQTFKKLSEPAFTVGTKLTCIVEGDQVKFQSYHNLRSIFDLSLLYQSATDQDIDDFSSHTSVSFYNLKAFKDTANQETRKLIHKVHSSGVLDKYTVADIQTSARATGLSVTIVNDAIEMPQDPIEAKLFLRFLDDGVYSAPLSSLRYVANSKRPMQ